MLAIARTIGKTFPVRSTCALLILVAVVPALAQVDDHRDIVYPELAEFEIPRPEIYDLPNGMKVFLIEDHELPLIDAIVRIRTGSVWEPGEKTGLAGLTGAVQRTGGVGGPRPLSGDELDDFLEARAASVETSIGQNVGFASMNVLQEDFDEVFQVFHDVLRYPVFAEDKLEVAKAQARSSVARRNDDVTAITAREFRRLVYGRDSALSRLTEYATLDAIGRNDLVAFHAEVYHPNNIYLGIVGDFDTAEMKRKIASVFADWPAGPVFDKEPAAYETERRPGVYFIEKTDVTQANIRLGHLGIRVQDPDYFAVRVLNEVLGGGFASRLVKSVRREKGLVYSVGGTVGAGVVYPGVAGWGLQTKSESMGQAVDAVLEVLEGMKSEPVTDEELDRAKGAILNSFIFNYASKAQVLGQQMLYSFYGLPLDWLESYRDEIDAVDRDDVTRAAAAHLHPDKLKILVVGRADEFDRPVDSFGAVEAVDITIPDPPAKTETVAATAENRAAGEEIFSRVVAALGGGEPVSGVHTEEEVMVSMQGQTMALTQEAITHYPDRLWVALTTPMGQQIMVADGETGFMTRGGQTVEASPEQVADQLAQLHRDPQFVVRFGPGEIEALAAGSAEVEGTPCDVVALSFRGAETRWCVDAKGRILKSSYRSEHPFTGAPGEFEVIYSDYREVNGRQVSFTATTSIDGSRLFQSTVKSFEFDPEVDPARFERPAA